MPAVEVDNLRVDYGPVAAVDGVSFDAAYGEVTVVLGPNGAGKTSTIECCEGYRDPTGGSVRVAGLDPDRQHGQLVHLIGVMLQGSGMLAAARPLEVLRQYASFYASPLDPADLLDRVGLTSRARSPWRSMSGGEKQRLSLALALIGRPRVAFLDEPSAGIDMEGRLLIREVLKSLKNDGVCVVLTTHDLDDVERSADRIVILDHGKVVANGTPDELLGSTQNEYVVFGAEPGLSLGILGAALGRPIDETSPGEYRVEGRPSPELFAKIAAVMAENDLPLRDIRAGRQRLDDLFLQLTRERSTAELPVIDAGRARK